LIHNSENKMVELFIHPNKLDTHFAIIFDDTRMFSGESSLDGKEFTVQFTGVDWRISQVRQFYKKITPENKSLWGTKFNKQAVKPFGEFFRLIDDKRIDAEIEELIESLKFDE
jgi:hypothetical protein